MDHGLEPRPQFHGKTLPPSHPKKREERAKLAAGERKKTRNVWLHTCRALPPVGPPPSGLHLRGSACLGPLSSSPPIPSPHPHSTPAQPTDTHRRTTREMQEYKKRRRQQKQKTIITKNKSFHGRIRQGRFPPLSPPQPSPPPLRQSCSGSGRRRRSCGGEEVGECVSGLWRDEPTRTASGRRIEGGPSEDDSASSPGEDPVVQDFRGTRQAARATSRSCDCQGDLAEGSLRQGAIDVRRRPSPRARAHAARREGVAERYIDESKRERDLWRAAQTPCWNWKVGSANAIAISGTHWRSLGRSHSREGWVSSQSRHSMVRFRFATRSQGRVDQIGVGGIVDRGVRREKEGGAKCRQFFGVSVNGREPGARVCCGLRGVRPKKSWMRRRVEGFCHEVLVNLEQKLTIVAARWSLISRQESQC